MLRKLLNRVRGVDDDPGHTIELFVSNSGVPTLRNLQVRETLHADLDVILDGLVETDRAE